MLHSHKLSSYLNNRNRRGTMRRIAAISVLLVFCGFVMADQDDIDLDPAYGKWRA